MLRFHGVREPMRRRALCALGRELASSVALYCDSTRTGYGRSERATHGFERSPFDFRVVAKAFEPRNASFAAEPRQLPLGITARCLLNGAAGLAQLQLAHQHFSQFAIADEIEWLCVFLDAGLYQPPHFVEPPASQHCLCPLLNALVQIF